MCAPDVASQFLEQAEAQAQSTLRRLWPTNPHLDDPAKRELCEQVLAQLKILYLFPQLPDWQRGLLATLHWQRQALLRLMNHRPSCRPIALRAQAEHLTRRLEHSYMSLVGQITGLADCAALSPIQQHILESEFLRMDSPPPFQRLADLR